MQTAVTGADRHVHVYVLGNSHVPQTTTRKHCDDDDRFVACCHWLTAALTSLTTAPGDLHTYIDLYLTLKLMLSLYDFNLQAAGK